MKIYDNKARNWQDAMKNAGFELKITPQKSFQSAYSKWETINELPRKLRKFLKKSDLFFLWILWKYQGFDGECDITNEKLADEAGCHITTVERRLSSLFSKLDKYTTVIYFRPNLPTSATLRRQIFIDWDKLIGDFSNDIAYPQNTGRKEEDLSSSVSSLNSYSSLNVFKKDILYTNSENSENSETREINSELKLAINPSQSLSEKEEDNLPSVNPEETSSTKINKDTPRMEIEDTAYEETSTKEGPPPQCGDSDTTLKKSFFVDGKKEILGNIRKDHLKAFSTNIQLHSLDFEEKEKEIVFKPLSSGLKKPLGSDGMKKASCIKELPQDIQDYMNSLPEEERLDLIERSKLMPLFIRTESGFPRERIERRKSEPVKIEDWKQRHYDKLERLEKEREKLEKEQKANRGLTKEELRGYRINNIKEVYHNWKEVLTRENCSLEEIKFRMRKNPLYEPFTKDTNKWNSECHPQYGFMTEDERDEEFRKCVDIWMWPKPFRHSERNIKMFKRARIRADKLKMLYYDWVQAIYCRIGELKIEYTHINCSFAEELIEKWIEDGEEQPANHGHVKRRNWLEANKKGGIRGKYRPRKTIEEETEEVRKILFSN